MLEVSCWRCHVGSRGAMLHAQREHVELDHTHASLSRGKPVQHGHGRRARCLFRAKGPAVFLAQPAGLGTGCE